MIPQFILDLCAYSIMTSDGLVYWFETTEDSGWVVYWPKSNETLHTYRNPADWLSSPDVYL